MIGEVRPGDDLAAILADALKAIQVDLNSQDILVVTQKIVSKAEGRFAELNKVIPGDQAQSLAEQTCKDARLVELILSESIDVVRAKPHVLITRHHSGFVMANAGIDQSNTGRKDRDTALLLPQDADQSAARIHEGLRERLGIGPAIVISDSFGRPWRYGVVGVAIGAAGFPAIVDRRGEMDRDGRRLEVTQVALGDLVASAAALATGEGAEGIPAVLIRGIKWQAPDAPAQSLVRPVEEDLFR